MTPGASVRLAVFLTLSLLTLPIAVGAQAGPSLRIPYDELPVPIKKVQPIYPASAREAQIRGKVVLFVLVDADGRVKNIKITRGVLGLNEAAVDCVRQWAFRPALSNNKSVAAWIQMSVSLPVDACPREVFEGARTEVVAHVGERFFTECLTLDSAGCALVPDWIGRSRVYLWALTYSLKIPKKPWVRGTIRAEVDTTGTAIAGRSVDGIGNCVQHPEECAFPVDEKTARAIAQRAGLKPGLEPWRTEFRWGKWPRPCYAWVVANTLRSDGSGGDDATIDANTGEILGVAHWSIQSEHQTGSVPIPTPAYSRPDTTWDKAH